MASYDYYQTFHENYQQEVDAEIDRLKKLSPDLLLANVPYVSLSAAAALGIPSIAKLETDQKKALDENAEGLKNNPEDPLLTSEREALKNFDMEFAAQLREKYFRKQLKAKRAEQKARSQAMNALITQENQTLSREAFIAGERWESANNLAKALSLYKEAAEIYSKNRDALLQISRVEKKLGNNQLALQATRSLHKLLDPKVDSKWYSIALSEEGGLLENFGDNVGALKQYRNLQQHIMKLVEAEPENTEWQRNLSVSFDRVGDMHKAKGDGVSALKAYEESLTIRKTLAKLNPDLVQWQTDLVVSYFKLSKIKTDRSQDLLGEALVILKRLNSENRLDHQKKGWIPILEDLLGS